MDVPGSARTPRLPAASTLSVRLLAVISAILLLTATPVAAQEENRAGLVIVHGDGSVATQCIAFAEEAISGAELLTRSRFDLSIEASSMGATICRIDGEGCTFPGEACFCQCQGSPCVYWSYWRLNDGAWRYSNLGAGNTVVHAGDVEGWRWGQGAVDQAEAPPAVTFQEICGASAQTPYPEPTPALDKTRPAATLSPLPSAPQAVTTQTAALPDKVTPTPLAALGIMLTALVILPAALLLWRWVRLVGKERKS